MTSVNLPQSERRDQNKRQWEGQTQWKRFGNQCATLSELVVLVEFTEENLLELSPHPFLTGSWLKNQTGLTSMETCVYPYNLWCIICLLQWIHGSIYILWCVIYLLQWIHVFIPTSSDESFIYYNGWIHPSLHSLIYHFNPSVPESNFISYRSLTNKLYTFCP